MKIFVTGASGFIGFEVCIGLRRAGHHVFGLVRSADKAKILEQNEIVAVVGDLHHPESYINVAEKCQVLIHTAADYSQFQKIDSLTVDTLLLLSEKSGPKSKMVIYTSGILVYPHNPDGVSDETTPTKIEGTLAERPKEEQKVVTSKAAVGVVIRPAFVYGRNTRHFIHYFKQALEGKVVVSGNPAISWSEVHIDDLVNGYVKIVDAPWNNVDGQIFNFADSSRNTNLSIATSYARAAGFQGEILVDTTSAFPYSQKTVIVDSSKARRYLGWVPLHLPMLEETELYFRFWKARVEFKK